MDETFEQGWAARPFKEQFPELDDKAAARLDSINKAITTLMMSDCLTFSQADAIRQKKFPKVVSVAINKARAALTQPAPKEAP